MIQKKKPPVKLFLVLLVVSLLLGYYISGLFTYPNLNAGNYQTLLLDIFRHPFANYWNETTFPFLGCLLIVWCFFIANYLQHNRNTHSDIEHGSSVWADVKKLNQILCDKNDLQNNRILSENLRVGLNQLSNNNGIFVGSPGTGKSMFVVTANLLLGGASFIFPDIKGELLAKYGNYLRSIGHQIRVLNLKDMGKSDRYNPFVYIQQEDDIPRLIMNIFKSVEPPEASKNDPFWDDGCALYLQSLFYFVWSVPPEEKLQILHRARIEWDPVYETPTMNQVLELTLLEAQPESINLKGGSAEEGYTKMTRLIDALEEKKGVSHPAVRDYRKLKDGAPETVSSIILILNAKLKFFQSPSVRRIFEADDMRLRELGMGREDDGKTKTALFLVLDENNPSYNFIVNMLYQQLFDVLIRTADFECRGPLPIRVEAWMDEFANGVRPERFENLITTLRSRNIAALIFLQSISQIKTLYKNDSWDILMDACSTFVFLGAGRGALSTQKFISELIGNATIDKASDGINYSSNGGGSLNFDRMQRALLTPEEVGRMPKNKCLILLEGRQPVLDNKYRPFKDENYKKAMALGPYEHPVQIRKRKDGSLETVKKDSQVIFANPGMQKKFMEKVQKPESPHMVFELTEEEFCAIRFPRQGDEDATEKFVRELQEMEQRKMEQMFLEKMEHDKKPTAETKTSEETWDLTGSISDLLEKYMDRLNDEQMEEIVQGIKNGLTEEEVKLYFCLPADKMKRLRISLERIHQT